MTHPNPSTLQRRSRLGLSFVRKCQILTAVFGLLLTVALLIAAAKTDPHHNPFVTLLLLISAPSFPLYGIFKIFGVNLLRFATTTAQGGFTIPFIILFITANTISYTVLGTFLGWIIQTMTKPKIPTVKALATPTKPTHPYQR